MFLPTLRQVYLHGRFLLFVALFITSGCAKDVVDPGEIYGGMQQPGADTILAFPEGGVTQTCQVPLSCVDPAPACGPMQVLGPEDGLVFELVPGATLEVGFRCSAVLEVGGLNSVDLRIAGTVPAGGQANLEVSEDGVEYRSLRPMMVSNYGADLGDIEHDRIRYIRLTNASQVAISIDAFVPIRPI